MGKIKVALLSAKNKFKGITEEANPTKFSKIAQNELRLSLMALRRRLIQIRLILRNSIYFAKKLLTILLEFLHFFGTTRARNHFIYKVVCIIGEFERYVGELREKVKPYVDTFLKQCLQQQLTTADNERIDKGPLNRHLHYLARPNDFPYGPPDLVYTSKNTANFSRSLPISNKQSKMGQSLSKENANLIQEGSSNCNLNNSAEERCYALLERLTEGFNTGIFDDDDEDPFDGNENQPATSTRTKDSASIQIDATSSTQPMANTSTETETSKEKRNHGGEAATNFRVDKQVARPY